MDNIEVLVIQWLKSVSTTEYPVYGDVPKSRPDTFITIDRHGGAREAMVLDRATILIEVWNKKSRLDASNQASAIADLVPSLVAYNDNITHADVNSLVNLPDLISPYHRYQIYCDIYHRR